MKTILIYSSYALAVTIGSTLLLIWGFSQIILYIIGILIALVVVMDTGLKYGFDRQLPKLKPSTIIIRFMRYGFMWILYINAEKTLSKSLFASLLNSKFFIVALWLWMMFELLIAFRKEHKTRSITPETSL